MHQLAESLFSQTAAGDALLPARSGTGRLAQDVDKLDLAARPARCEPEDRHIRRLHPGESDLILGHLLRLGPDARRLRFGNAVNAAFLERYAAMALGNDALVKGLFIEGTLRGIAELRFLTDSYHEAEGAFSIEPEFQGRGHGDRLFGGLIASARNRGVRRLFLTCLRENRRMQAIATKYGADLSFVAGEVTAEILRPYADAASLSREMADESEAFVFALLGPAQPRPHRLDGAFEAPRFGDHPDAFADLSLSRAWLTIGSIFSTMIAMPLALGCMASFWFSSGLAATPSRKNG